MVDTRRASPAAALHQAHARSLRPGGKESVTASQPIPTETAVAAFSILTGVGSAVSNVLAAHRLSTLPADSIELSSLAMPVGLIFLGAVAGSFLVPSGGSTLPTEAIPTASPYDRVGARRLTAKKDEEEDRWDY